MFSLALIEGVGHHVVSSYISSGPGIASVVRRVNGERRSKQKNEDTLHLLTGNGIRVHEQMITKEIKELLSCGFEIKG